MNVLTVLEHQRIDDTQVAKGQLTAHDYQWLLEQTAQGHLPCFECGIHQGKAVLVVRHYLAVLLLPSGRYLEILPKVSQIENPADLHNSRQGVRALVNALINTLLPKLSKLNPIAMTAVAPTNGIALSSLNIDIDTPCDWVKILLTLWQQQLVNLPTILPRTYVTQWQNHPQAQGKLHLKKQICHNTHRPHFRYTSDAKLTWHFAWYGLFFMALQQAQRLGVCLNPSSYQVVNALKHGYDGNGLQPLSVQLYPRAFYHQLLTHINSQNQHIAIQFQQRFVVDMACWLLNLPTEKLTQSLPDFGLSSPLTKASHQYTPALMFNMSKLFELWVVDWFKQRLPNRLQTQQATMWLTDDEGGQKFIRPDLQILPQTLPTSALAESDLTSLATLGLTATSHIVIDVKYKVPNGLSQVLTSDLYQIYSYQTLLKADASWLIYPASPFLQQPKRLHLHGGGHIDLLGFDMMTGELLIKI